MEQSPCQESVFSLTPELQTAISAIGPPLSFSLYRIHSRVFICSCIMFLIEYPVQVIIALFSFYFTLVYILSFFFLHVISSHFCVCVRERPRIIINR